VFVIWPRNQTHESAVETTVISPAEEESRRTHRWWGHADIVLRSSWTSADRLPDPTLQEPLLRSCNSFGGKFFQIPPPPLSPHFSTCDYHIFGLMKKAAKGNFIAKDGAIQDAITSWLQRQPQDLYRRTRETVIYVSQPPRGICRITWSLRCAVCLFIKQPL